MPNPGDEFEYLGCVVGLRLTPGRVDADFYFLWISPQRLQGGDSDFAVGEGRRAFLFSNLDRAVHLLDGLQKNVYPGMVVIDPVNCIDVPETMRMIAEGVVDEQDVVVNTYNTLRDILRHTAYEAVPRRHRRALFDLQHHLTFDKNIGLFFEKSKWSRKRVRDGFLWLVGAVFASVQIEPV